MIVTQAINVHLDKQSTPTIETVQSDTGRTVTANLFNQGLAWEPPAGATGMVRHSILHDGEIYTSAYDTLSNGKAALTFSGSQMTLHLSPEILSIPGVGELQVGILHNDVLVATMSMLLRVQRNIGTQGLAPTAYTDLSQHIQNELTRQFRNVYDQGSWLEQLHHRVDIPYTVGGLDDNGELDTSRTSTICSDMVYHGGREVCVAFPAGITVRCMFYDADYNCTAIGMPIDHSFTMYNTQTFMRLEVGYEDGGRVQDPQWLAAQVGIFYPDTFQGHIGTLKPKSFFECSDAGYYQFKKSNLAALSDAPDIHAGGILEVIPHADNDVIFQRLWTSDGQLWFRKGSDDFRQLTASSTLTVRFTPGEGEDGSIDKSFADIRDAIDSGKVVQCLVDGHEILPLVRDYGDSVMFGRLLEFCEVNVWATADAQAWWGVADPFQTGIGGLTDREKELLLTLLRNATYNADYSGVIDELEDLWGNESGEPDTPEEPDEPDATTFTVTNNLTNATTTNAAVRIDSGAAYAASIVAADGYELSAVTVTMGSADVTAMYYSDGGITIPSVTGNIVITAVAAVPAGADWNILYCADGSDPTDPDNTAARFARIDTSNNNFWAVYAYDYNGIHRAAQNMYFYQNSGMKHGNIALQNGYTEMVTYTLGAYMFYVGKYDISGIIAAMNDTSLKSMYGDNRNPRFEQGHMNQFVFAAQTEITENMLRAITGIG